MKAPGFWYQPAGVIAAALQPLATLYRYGGAARRMAATPYKSSVPVICVGNIVAGGAGKTPAALAIAGMLRTGGARPVFVTRGYGGSEHGPLQVDPARHTAREVGDEALLLARIAPVFAGRDRAAALRLAEKHGSHVIMDDGLQNPTVKPGVAFLVIDGEVGLGNGRIMPAGPLREALADALRRVDAVIITGNADTHNIAAQIPCPVVRARWQPHLPDDFPRGKKFLAFAGIGRPAKFYQTCRDAGLTLAATRDFPDHHLFSARDMYDLLLDAAAQDALPLTTEKDWVRLPDNLRGKVLAFPARLVFDHPERLESFFGAV